MTLKLLNIKLRSHPIAITFNLNSRWKKCKGVLSQLTSGDSAARCVGICYNFELD